MMKSVSLAAVCAATIVTLATSRASAQGYYGAPRSQPRPWAPSTSFGSKSELAISSDAALFFGNSSVSGIHGSTTTIQIRPSVDYFVIDDLSVGGFVGIDYSSTTDQGHTTTFSIGPRVGYNFSVAHAVSIWPTVGLSFGSTSRSLGQGGGSSSTSHLGLEIFVPIMLHPAPHFFIGFGPALYTEITGDFRATNIAAALTIGGWIGPLR